MNQVFLLTLGYSGYDQNSFIEELKGYDVEVVIDVRRNPISRKKGFSRSSLSKSLIANDVDYLHESNLGVPNELRDQLKTKKRGISSYFEEYRAYLDDHVDVLDRIYTIALEHRCCLICLEHLPEECHRSVVAEAIESRNGHKLQIMHVQ